MYSIVTVKSKWYFLPGIHIVIASMKAVLEKENKTSAPLHRGFNENIKWMTFVNGEEESRLR